MSRAKLPATTHILALLARIPALLVLNISAVTCYQCAYGFSASCTFSLSLLKRHCKACDTGLDTLEFWPSPWDMLLWLSVKNSSPLPHHTRMAKVYGGCQDWNSCTLLMELVQQYRQSVLRSLESLSIGGPSPKINELMSTRTGTKTCTAAPKWK